MRRNSPNLWFGFARLISLAALASFVAFAYAGRTSAIATNAEDEAALRSLAENLYRAMEQEDPKHFLSLWSAQSPNDQMQTYARTYFRATAVRLNIRKIQMDGGRATVHVELELKRIGPPTKSTVPQPRGFIGWFDLQTLRCVKEQGEWKVLQRLNSFDDIAEKIVNAPSKEARGALVQEYEQLIANKIRTDPRDSLELERSLLAQAVGFTADNILEYDFEKGLDIHRLALEMHEANGEKTKIVEVLAILAFRFAARGDNAQSLEYYLKSIRRAEQLSPAERAQQNYMYVNIGTLYAQQGFYAQALELYQRGLNQQNPQGWVMLNIANAYANLGDYERALEYCNRVLSMSEQLPESRERNRQIANALRQIGSIYLAKGDYPLARENFGKALALFEAEPQQSRGAIPGLLNNLAMVELAQGNANGAVELIERAMSMRRPQANLPGGDPMLTLAARAYLAVGQKERARELLEKAIAGAEYRRSHAAGGEQGRQRYFEQLIAPYHEMVRLLISDQKSAEAFAYAERSKARALLDVLDSGRVELGKSLTADERKRDVELRKNITMLNRDLDFARQAANQARITALESDLAKARLEYEAFETNLYSVHPELRVTRGELTPINLAETGGLVRDPKTALIEYVVTDETTYLFVITKPEAASQPLLKVYPIDIKRKDLETQVTRYRTQIANRDPAFQKNAAELFSLLIRPALSQLSKASSLIIVPDGVLWDLPFQALRSENQRYLIEERTIFYAPSLTALREMAKAKKRPGTEPDLDLLALGNPTKGAIAQNRVKTGLMDYEAEPLPEAEKQVAALGQIYGPRRSKVYTGSEATESRAKTEAPRSRIIQFATHGILDSRSPMYSHLLLSQGGENEDGLLEAWEIMKMDLHADMVVLAACETARGRVGAGEGMIGMAWAFFVAGSSTTVASQWKVDSASTTELMLQFHRNLKGPQQDSGPRMSKARALQLGALKLLKSKQYQHPFYWAGFVLVGDGF